MTKRYYRARRFALSFTAIALVQGTAYAQSGKAADAGGGNPVAESAGLEDIVVTAQRRSENLQNVPIAITALNATALKNAGITATTALQFATPGLVTSTQVSGLTPFLRGVGAPSATMGVESPVALYVDGVYYGSSVGNVVPFTYVDRIEVLKGPQGTLFGRNATGGLISITTRTPQMDPLFEGSIGYGNYDTFSASAYATAGTGNVAFDIAADITHQGKGYGKNLTTGKDVNIVNNRSVRAKLLWTPSPDLRVTITANYLRDKGDFGLAYNANPGSILLDDQSIVGKPNDARMEFQAFQDTKVWGASGRIELDTGIGTISSLTAYRKIAPYYGTDLDGTAVPFGGFRTTAFSRSVQEELMLSGKSGSLEYTAGLFFYHANEGFRPIALFSSIVPALNYSQFAEQTTDSYAAFAQATYAITSDTRITGGIRYTIDRREVNGQYVTTAGNTLPVGSILVAVSGQNATFKRPSWRLSIDHKLNDNTLIYGSYNRGFKSGLFNLNELGGNPIKPEKLDAFALGFKTELFDRHLRLNAEGFYYNYSNMQISKYIAGNQLMLNAATARIYGIDADAAFTTDLPFGNFRAYANLSLLNAKYRSFKDAPISTPTGTGGNVVGAGDASGNRLFQAPKWTVSAGFDLTVPIGEREIVLSTAYKHNDGFFWEADNRVRQSAYDIVNASLAIGFGRDNAQRLKVWGKNLNNAHYSTFTQGGVLGDLASYAAPRTYGVTFEFKY